ncbi:MAG: alanine--glyoxylate aminotransferase family protein [Syntrophorhabdaceae bacterium]|nr:alanine--glyoxylate aminotransferase family protein [Syntrophorhabdaceae bacterium]MDD5245299.1 alanine--glyoxylate aminotransferase family protein [Syntrophorhabdaceae bacterium]
MKNLLEGIEDILLMGPGPSCVPPAVYSALSRTTLGHLDPYFLNIAEELKEMLRRIMNTRNNLTIPISGTGSAGMEAAFVNLVEQGDRVLILLNGVFGMRMQDVATRLGGSVDALEFTWGTPVEPGAVEERIRQESYKIVAVVHAETSTGVRNPVAEIGALLKGSDTIYLVDTVTSLGGIEVRMDDWNADVLYSGTQKCLSCPPGLAPFSLNEKAMAKLNGRKTKVPNWYLDLTMIADYWGQNRVYHHTAPVNMLYGLYQALLLILEEGPEDVFRRHRESHMALVGGLEEMGLRMLVDEPYRLPMLNAVCVPEGVDELSVRKRLRSEFRIEIGGGLGPLAGKIWRIGVMGHTARKENVARFLSALKEVLRKG